MSTVLNSSLHSRDVFLQIWENFIYHNKVDKRIRPEILQSWQRCKELNVDPFSSRVAQLLEINEFKNINKRKQHLIRIAKPYIRLLNQYVKGSGFIIFLADENGTVLVLDGDPEEVEKQKQINLIEGAVWTERAAGTNAVGTSIYIRQPVQVWGEEHYCVIQHGITCSGSPIYGPAGDLVGVLNMSGNYEKVNIHTLGMVVASAMAIQNQLKIEKGMTEMEKSNLIMNTTLESVPNGIITVDADGIITQLNSLGARLLQVDCHEAIGRCITKILPTEVDLAQFLRQGASSSLEVMSNQKGTGISCTISANPLYNQALEYTGSVLMVHEKEQVQRLVNQMTGAEAKFNFDSIIGNNKSLRRAKKVANAAAMTNSTVLLLGESGTGKELFAQAIHNASRRKGAFIAINCSAIPRTLIESELFGYDAGSFTGAQKNGRPGKFERANHGTILLDEIGDMPFDLQTVLLRVLQERAIVRVGGYKPIPVDVRVIAATNCDLQKKINEGVFREDLFFRLNVITINIPPLRQRKDDIPLLVNVLLPQISVRINKKIDGVSPQALQSLKDYHWPGNVRELENVLERSVVVTTGNIIKAEDLPSHVLRQNSSNAAIKTLDELEKEAIFNSLAELRSLTEVAQALGISRSTLYRKIKQYGLEVSSE